MIELIQKRLESYQPSSITDEQQALREIVQEVALYGLWRAGFFEVAAFQGGTSLRVLHGLPRFSEDLDFILKKPAPDFNWQHYLEPMIACCAEFGLRTDAQDKSRMDQRVRKALLKDNSIANQLDLAFQRGGVQQPLKIKLEVDVNPPAGSGFGFTYLDFPLDCEICHQDLASNFALKIHALLCRPYLKGRDWFDFAWYANQRMQPNLQHLQAALRQWGPWQGEVIEVDAVWLRNSLQEKINTVDWKKAAQDVERFLNPAGRESLRLWSPQFFMRKLDGVVGI
jgi:hypothetical protein